MAFGSTSTAADQLRPAQAANCLTRALLLGPGALMGVKREAQPPGCTSATSSVPAADRWYPQGPARGFFWGVYSIGRNWGKPRTKQRGLAHLAVQVPMQLAVPPNTPVPDERGQLVLEFCDLAS